jgi:hypothetical protein
VGGGVGDQSRGRRAVVAARARTPWLVADYRPSPAPHLSHLVAFLRSMSGMYPHFVVFVRSVSAWGVAGDRMSG